MSWMQTRSGKAFDFINPDPASIDIFDIAHSLSNLCRFGGHSAYFYSVAEHSVHVSHTVPAAYAFTALMHDATEAYLIDLPRPLKDLLPEYKEIENRVWSVIAPKFELPLEIPEIVKDADDRVLLRERDSLMTRPPRPWVHAVGKTPAPNIYIGGLNPGDAKELFLRRYRYLQRERMN
jgi:uncharacterized protein